MADQHFERGKSVGIFNVSRHLASRLSRHSDVRDFTVFVNDSIVGELELRPGTRTRVCNGAARSRAGRIWWDQIGAYREARRSGNEWLLLAKGFASFIAPCPVQLSAIVCDAMHDYYEQMHPGFFSWPERWYFRKSLEATFRQARVIFTISDFAARELARVATRYRVPCPPIVTMGIGFSPVAVGDLRKEDSVLVLVSPHPHKRSEEAMAFVDRWRRESGFRGVIQCVGGLGAGCSVPQDSNWRFNGRMPDADYQRLLQTARVVVYVSEYEGFGMPPVESVLAQACPVYSGIPVMREVMDGAGCPFSNGDFESFRRAMDAAIATPDAQIKAWGSELLRRHSWEKAEARLVEGLRAFGA